MERGLGQPQRVEEARCSSGGERGHLTLHGRRDPADEGAGSLGDLVQLGQARVPAGHVVLREVQAVEDRLQREELESLEDPALLGGEPLRAEGHALRERPLRPPGARARAARPLWASVSEPGPSFWSRRSTTSRSASTSSSSSAWTSRTGWGAAPSTADGNARTTCRSASAWRSSPTSSVARSPAVEAGEVHDLDARVDRLPRLEERAPAGSRGRRAPARRPRCRRPRPLAGRRRASAPVRRLNSVVLPLPGKPMMPSHRDPPRVESCDRHWAVYDSCARVAAPRAVLDRARTTATVTAPCRPAPAACHAITRPSGLADRRRAPRAGGRRGSAAHGRRAGRGGRPRPPGAAAIRGLAAARLQPSARRPSRARSAAGSSPASSAASGPPVSWTPSGGRSRPGDWCPPTSTSPASWPTCSSSRPPPTTIPPRSAWCSPTGSAPSCRRTRWLTSWSHVLQDRLVDLDRFLAAAPGESDAALARQALVEGEAVALAHDARLRRQGTDLAASRRRRRSSAPSGLRDRARARPRAALPADLLTFPYAERARLRPRVPHAGPVGASSRRLPGSPRSSAQILHPERYLDRREDPVPLALPDLAPAARPGLAAADRGRAGRDRLGRGAPESSWGTAETAAGWRGDRYALWEAAGRRRRSSRSSCGTRRRSPQTFADAYARCWRGSTGSGPRAADRRSQRVDRAAPRVRDRAPRRTVAAGRGGAAAALRRACARRVWAGPVLY